MDSRRHEMKIHNILATKGTGVTTIGPNEAVRDALRSLSGLDIGGLVVVDDARNPVGIITERDIIREAARNENLFSQPVHELMTSDLITATPDDDVDSVAVTMTDKRLRHMPIISEGKLVGILSIRDVVKALHDQLQGEVDTLQTQLIEGC